MTGRHKIKSGRRGWWRSLFYDCPEDPTDEHFNIFGTSLKAGKTKVACKLCFDAAYESLCREEEANVQNGVQEFARSDDFLKTQSKIFYLIF